MGLAARLLKGRQIDANLGNCPPKAEVTSSNLVGRANTLNELTRTQAKNSGALSAECPRNLFVRCSRLARAGPPKNGAAGDAMRTRPRGRGIAAADAKRDAEDSSPCVQRTGRRRRPLRTSGLKRRSTTTCAPVPRAPAAARRTPPGGE